MATFIDRHGIAVEAPEPSEINGDEIKRAQDLIIVKLLRRRYSMVKVAKIMSVPEWNIRRRLAAMPERTKRFYERCDALGELGAT